MRRFLVVFCAVFAILLVVSVAYPDTATLRWDANTDPIDGYNIYQQQGTAPFVFIDDVPCTENDPICSVYTTNQLLWATTYSWFVTAFKGPTGESGPSNTVSHTTRPEPVYNPTNPTGCYIESINPQE